MKNFEELYRELGIEYDDLLAEKENYKKENADLRQELAGLKNTVLTLKKDIVVYQSTLKSIGAQLHSNAEVLDNLTKIIAL